MCAGSLYIFSIQWHGIHAGTHKCQSYAHTQVDMDFEPLVAVASMLYGASFVAERYSGLRSFLEAGSDEGAAAVKKRKLFGLPAPSTMPASSRESDDATDSEVNF